MQRRASTRWGATMACVGQASMQALQLHGLPATRLGHSGGAVPVARQIVHARGDHAHGAGHQLGRAGALQAMGGHVMHVTMEPLRQPLHQSRF